MAKVKLERPSKAKPGLHYYVQPTLRDGKRLFTGPGLEARDEADARRIAERMFNRAAGVVAFEVETDMDGELISEPRILMTIGAVPGISDPTAEEVA